MTTEMKMETRSLASLRPAEYNPRVQLQPADPEYQNIKRSIETFGYVDPIIINQDGTIIGGHQRYNVMKDLGYTEAQVVVVDLDKNNEKALNIALNKITGEWDEIKLKDLLLDLDLNDYDLTATGFSSKEVEDLVIRLDKDVEAEDDDFDADADYESIEEPVTQRGDIWILGDHRLMCGDSTDLGDVNTLMGGEEAPRLVIKNKGQTIIMLCGLQGNGKTTHAAKLAKYYIKQGRRPMLVACDIYRPAAIDQLQVVGRQAGAPVFTLPGEKPPAIAKKALAHAKDYGNDIIILDTAGRLQIDEVLMQELVQIKEAVPVDETLLVVDAMAGQDAVNVAKTFNETVGIDGIILTKTDGDTRGGAALSVLSVTGKPIKFQGTGEKLDDLDVFHPDRMADRILGMGDIMSLVEQAQDKMDIEASTKSANRMMSGQFTLTDMLVQFQQLEKMGSLGGMMKLIPGMNQLAGQIDEAKAGNKMKKSTAIIQSMTMEERENPNILRASRKNRIAKGSGTSIQEVNRLLKQFDSTRKMMKMVTGSKMAGMMQKMKKR